MPKKPPPTIDLGFLQESAARTDLSGMFAASVASESDLQQAAMVKLDRLLNNPYQPRLELDDEGIDELAQVIKSQGFQGVLVARPDPTNKRFYQITAGHRRREAARRAGLAALPVVVRDLTDEEMVTIAITENIHREDLTALEEGMIYLLMSEEMSFTHEQIAREVGKKRGYIENRLRLARAPRDVQALIQAKPDSIRAVATIIKVKDQRDRADIISNMLSGRLTVEDLPGYVESQAAQKKGDGWAGGRATDISTSRGPEGEPRAGLAAPEKGDAEGREESEEDRERARVRIGNAKLAAVVRYLTTYREQAGEREAISKQERARIAEIKAIVGELSKKYRV
jgi:ParB family chromosome partitioning protein